MPMDREKSRVGGMTHSFSFDWSIGKGALTSGDKAAASIVFAGDWAPIRAFQPIIENNPQSIYGDLLDVIRSADLSVVNLEAPLSDTGDPVDKSGAVFKGERKHINGLSCVPFNAVTLANNHVFDYGLEAFQNTCAVLDDQNIQYTGAGLTEKDALKPLILEANGIKIGIVNFSEGEDLTAAGKNKPGVMGWNLDAVVQTIAALKKEVNLVVAVSHCGVEYIPFPPPYVADAFKRMAEAGADLVIGHHPHVPQGISFHQNTPICHSLGNFVFYQNTRLKFRKLGYMVKAGVAKSGLVSIDVVPYKILPDSLRLLKESETPSFFSHLKAVSDPLMNDDTLNESWQGFLDYYGKTGFFNEMNTILEKLQAEPKKGAAMFRNRLTTLQHFHHLKDLMSRIVNDDLDSAPQWAVDLAEQWLTETLED